MRQRVIAGFGADRTPRASGWLLATLAACALALLLASCGDDGDEADPPGAPATGASLREVDFTDAALAAELINRAGGGEIVPERTVFEDLDGDGVEEAVVIVESGGTAGDLAAGIFRSTADGPELAYFAQSGGRVEVRVGVVIFQSGIWGPDDPGCCPSQLREVGVGWNGDAFVELSDQIVDAPEP